MSKLNDFTLGEAVTPEKIGEICVPLDFCAPLGGGDVVVPRADLLAAALAYATAQGYTPTAPAVYEITNVRVGAYKKGAKVLAEGEEAPKTITKANACATVTEAGNPLVVNAGGQENFGVCVADQDCNGATDNILADDFEVSIEDGGAVRLNVCIAPYIA